MKLTLRMRLNGSFTFSQSCSRAEKFKKEPSYFRYAFECELPEMSVQLLRKAWDASTKSFLPKPWLFVIVPCVLFNHKVIHFYLALQPTDCFLFLKPQKTVLEAGSLLFGTVTAYETAGYWLPEVDAVLCALR